MIIKIGYAVGNGTRQSGSRIFPVGPDSSTINTVSAGSFIIKRTNIKTGKQLLFYMTSMIWVLSYALLAFSVSLILNKSLSVFYVGLFMSITSFIAIFADIPLGYIQKIISGRWLLFLSLLGLIFTTFIFLGGQSIILITFLAVLIYGISHDLYDITMLSYIFQNSHPEEYSQNISQKNVAEALGLLAGLSITSTFGLVEKLFDPLWIALIFFIVVSLFILIFFNKTEYDVQLSDFDVKVLIHQFTPDELMNNLEHFMVGGKKVALDKIAEAKDALRQKMEKKQMIVLRPIRPLQKFEQKSFSKELKKSFQGVGSIFAPPKLPLIWSGITIAFFSFWDTFVITFQPIFISEQVIKPAGMGSGLTGVIIAIFIIPLFVCQVPFAKIADKIGRPFFIYLGTAISAVSVFGFSYSTDVAWIILVGLANSVGYAAAFPTGQAFFAQRFQENYAMIHNTQTMDANTAAGPLKMLINFGNVFGTLMGGVLISVFDFKITFMILSGFLAVFFLLSLLAAAWVTKPIMAAIGVPVSPNTATTI